MHKKKRILISIDHKWRDLPGHIFLGMYLEQVYGHEVIFARNYDELKYWRAFQPDVVVINHLIEENRRRWAREQLPPQVKLCILPTEGITATKSDMPSLLGGDRPEYKRIDAMLAWVGDLQRHVTGQHHIDKQKIVGVGVPRLDFYFDEKLRSPFLTPDQVRKKLALRPGHKTITNVEIGVVRDIENVGIRFVNGVAFGLQYLFRKRQGKNGSNALFC
jgi:surface carbohydrate biosynthesis protein